MQFSKKKFKDKKVQTVQTVQQYKKITKIATSSKLNFQNQ